MDEQKWQIHGTKLHLCGLKQAGWRHTSSNSPVALTVDDIRHPFPVLLFTSAESTAPVEGIVMLTYKHAYRRKRKRSHVAEYCCCCTCGRSSRWTSWPVMVKPDTWKKERCKRRPPLGLSSKQVSTSLGISSSVSTVKFSRLSSFRESFSSCASSSRSGWFQIWEKQVYRHTNSQQKRQSIQPTIHVAIKLEGQHLETQDAKCNRSIGRWTTRKNPEWEILAPFGHQMHFRWWVAIIEQEEPCNMKPKPPTQQRNNS